MRRFDHDHYYMQENDDGRYVLHSDHAAELARVEGERDANRRLLNKALKGNTLLRAECEAWREVDAARKRYFDDDYDGPSGIDEAGEMLTKARAATDAAGILRGAEQ